MAITADAYKTKTCTFRQQKRIQKQNNNKALTSNEKSSIIFTELGIFLVLVNSLIKTF